MLDRATLSTHFDQQGRVRMVDVTEKPVTRREAEARDVVRLNRAGAEAVRSGGGPKGDVRRVAELAGIMATKRTPDLIPLCHPLPIDSVSVTVELDADGTRIEVRAAVTTHGRTGIEMEALTAVAVASLTVYDMLKGIDRGITIETIELVRKSGGRSGDYCRGQSE